MIRLRTLSARLRGLEPGPEASVRKAISDEHGQHVMALAKTLAGTHGLLADHGPFAEVDGGIWNYGYLYSRAFTIGGGTSEVQRNILGERCWASPRAGRLNHAQALCQSSMPPVYVMFPCRTPPASVGRSRRRSAGRDRRAKHAGQLSTWYDPRVTIHTVAGMKSPGAPFIALRLQTSRSGANGTEILPAAPYLMQRFEWRCQ